MTKKELEEIRDGRAFAYDSYKKGFNDCMEILLPIIKDYEEALDIISKERKSFGTLPHIAREVLKKHRGNE